MNSGNIPQQPLSDQLLNEWIKCHDKRAFTGRFIKLASVHSNIFSSSSKIRRARSCARPLGGASRNKGLSETTS